MKKIFLLIISLTFSMNVMAQTYTLQEKAAKMLIVGVDGTTVEENGTLVNDIKEFGVSGVIFFEKNISQTGDAKAILQKFTSDLQSLTSYPLFISIDQEGGKVNRLKTKYGFSEMVSQQSVGDIDKNKYSREVASIIASEVASVGFNLNFAPCVDVNVNPNCPVIGKSARAFSSDEKKVSKLAQIYIKEHHKAGILTSIKHFPGHGNSLKDSHHGFTDITTTWERRELIPYRDIIDNSLCDMVMVSHLYNRNIDSIYPATLSEATINGLLRQELGWDGVVISDDMQMGAITKLYTFEKSIIQGVKAGVDLFIISGNLKNEKFNITRRFIMTIVNAVNRGELTEEQIDKSFERIEELRRKI